MELTQRHRKQYSNWHLLNRHQWNRKRRWHWRNLTKSHLIITNHKPTWGFFITDCVCVSRRPYALSPKLRKHCHSLLIAITVTLTAFLLSQQGPLLFYSGPVVVGRGAPCWQPASSEGTMFTAMAANARMHPCDRLQTIQSGFNNTTNLAMHTCLFLKCCEAKELVNHSVADSNSQKTLSLKGNRLPHART